MTNSYIYKIILLFAVSLVSIHSYGQEPIFSVATGNDTYLNPANTFNSLTSDTYLKLDVQFRDQWNSISSGDSYATSKLQAEYNLYESQYDAWNVGLIFLSDQSSARSLGYTTFQVLGSYTRKLTGDRRNNDSHMVSFGGAFGFNQLRSSIGDLWFGRQFNLTTFSIDNSLMSGEEFRTNGYNYNSLNVGGRWTYFIEKGVYYTAALSLSNLNSPSVSTLDDTHSIDPRLIFQTEAAIYLAEGFQHMPALTFVSQAGFWQLVPSYKVAIDINSDEDSFSLVAGVGMRTVNSIESIMADAVLFNLGLQSANWRFSFNFDMNISSLKTFTNNNGAIELALGYQLISN